MYNPEKDGQSNHQDDQDEDGKKGRKRKPSPSAGREKGSLLRDLFIHPDTY